MVDAYHMIIVNTVATFIIGIFLLFYRFVFPKKPLSFPLILLLLSILPIMSIFRKGPYESGDLSHHVKFAMAFYEALREGIIIPRWASILCGGYGCPHFIFLYILPYYIISFFHLLGLSFISSVKALLISAYILSGFSMYVFTKELTSKKGALLASTLYLFAPYHLVDLHFRVAIGEVLAFVFPPLLFYLLKKISDKRELHLSILFGIFLTCFILSHQAISLLFFPFFVIYSFLLLPKKQPFPYIVHVVFAFVLGLLLSAFYWMPIVFEGSYTSYGLSSGLSFLSFWELFYAPWRYGFLFQGPTGHLSFLVGYAQIIILILGIFFLLKKKIDKKQKPQFSFFLLSAVILMFLTLSITEPLWNYLPFFNKIQSTYRLLLPIVFFIAVCGGIIIKNIKNWLLILLICLAIFPTILNWGNRRTIPNIDDSYLRREIVGSSSGHDLIVPKWVDIQQEWSMQKPKENIKVFSGNASIRQINRTTTKREYIVRAETETILQENTYYFPGWEVFVDNARVPITYDREPYRGLMFFNVSKGLHLIDVTFTDTPLRKAANIISLITLISIGCYLLLKQMKLPKHT